MMKTFMWKILPFVLLPFALAACSQQSHAADEAKLDLVKKLYTHYTEGDGAEEIKPEQFFTPDFRAVLNRDSKAAKAEGVACMDYDYVIQGQDFDRQEIARTIQYKLTKSGRVYVSFENFGEARVLDYVLSCNQGVCLIDDIIEPDGSFKKNTVQCLDKLAPADKQI